MQAHAARISASYAGKIACRAGCSGCCATDRTVTDVEAASVERAVAGLTPEVRAKLGKGKGCTMLVNDRCAIYAARPLICRSHGLPIDTGADDGPGRDVCPLNFTDGSLASLEDGDVLSLTTVNTILGAVNLLYCREAGGKAKRRRGLRELVGAK